MHDKTDQLIASLANETPRAPLSLRSVCGRWIAGFMAYLAVLVAVTGVRSDLAEALARPWFVAEMLVLLALVISTAFCGVLAAYPDRHQHARITYLPAFLMLIFFAILGMEWMQAPPNLLPPLHDIECLLCISAYALLPGAWLLYQMHKLASVRPSLAGALALVASFSLGAFATRLKEATDYIPHLITWHYLPMFLAALVGMVLGRWLLRW